MQGNQRSILKEVLSGRLNAAQLSKALKPAQDCTVFTFGTTGLYSGNGYSNIPEDEMMSLVTGNVVFLLPDNGR